jgi:hypothetical protein
LFERGSSSAWIGLDLLAKPPSTRRFAISCRWPSVRGTSLEFFVIAGIRGDSAKRAPRVADGAANDA